MLVLLAVSGLNTKKAFSGPLKSAGRNCYTCLNQNRGEKYMALALINSHNLLSGTEVLKSKHFVEFKQSASGLLLNDLNSLKGSIIIKCKKATKCHLRVCILNTQGKAWKCNSLLQNE